MWFIGVEVEQETRAPPPKKNPGSAPGTYSLRVGVMRPPGIKGSSDENTAFLSFLSYVAGGFVRAH